MIQQLLIFGKHQMQVLQNHAQNLLWADPLILKVSIFEGLKEGKNVGWFFASSNPFAKVLRDGLDDFLGEFLVLCILLFNRRRT